MLSDFPLNVSLILHENWSWMLHFHLAIALYGRNSQSMLLCLNNNDNKFMIYQYVCTMNKWFTVKCILRYQKPTEVTCSKKLHGSGGQHFLLFFFLLQFYFAIIFLVVSIIRKIITQWLYKILFCYYIVTMMIISKIHNIFYGILFLSQSKQDKMQPV